MQFKKYVLERFHLGMSFSVIGYKFNVDEFPLCHPGKQKICQFVCEAAPSSAKVTLIEHDETMEKHLNLWSHEMTHLKTTTTEP